MRRAFGAPIAVVAAVAMVLLVSSGGSDPYRVNMRVANANGLRDGSPVVIGGVSVGKVHLSVNPRFATIELRLEDKYAPVGRDATATITAQNVLGQKRVTLLPGDARRDPAPSGYVIPPRQTAASADLDQLLSALDAPTRVRLAVLVNELGSAFYGRQLDFHSFVSDVVPALESGQNLLGQLASENARLGSLLRNADAFVASLAASRVRIADGLDALGEATRTMAARRESLRATLRAAPGALATTRSFLADLQSTTGPLASTARLLNATSPSLRSTLGRIAPFTAAAKPALDAAAAQTAPALTRLAGSGTRNVSALLPAAVNASALVGQDVPAVGDTLDGSIDNLLAVLHNWTRAIQFRDGVSHVFRGEATIAPSQYSRLLERLGIDPTSKAGGRRARPGRRPLPQPHLPAASNAPVTRPPHVTVPGPLKNVGPEVQKTVDRAKSLLDFLLEP